ncbi:non-specific lipid transfer protein GPI-anchored 5 [Ricinus communis]|uniref:Lipid binding protein, putative n=1 Tax=Ricinus communis TaxID=3988 RepID=B9SFJ0_RICCO|nr:non-specific lipid transfer protein GPI-anchored 5 [Ricinus communis]EEF37602.1 lipid binding protein, putative [Ricinus communis]|eukprot:XP_002524759.1 non-specific lipid-transfer protein-like protein At2g13820 [Ricinus communis]
MALKRVEMIAFLVLVMMICHGAVAQSGCTSALMGLAPCLNYVTGNSSTPSSSCCSQLATVVQSQPQCLCAMLNGGGSSLGITINQTLALSLPGACNVQTPPVSQCNAANNGPATSPIGSPLTPPADSSDDTPETPNTPSIPSFPAGGGSKIVPAAGGTSAASITRIQLHLTIFTIFTASCASNVIRF